MYICILDCVAVNKVSTILTYHKTFVFGGGTIGAELQMKVGGKVEYLNGWGVMKGDYKYFLGLG